LGRDPREVAADAYPEVVVAPRGDRSSVGVAQQRSLSGRAALVGVLLQVRHQRRGGRLVASRWVVEFVLDTVRVSARS
jgi:hypothetical protein